MGMMVYDIPYYGCSAGFIIINRSNPTIKTQTWDPCHNHLSVTVHESGVYRTYAKTKLGQIGLGVAKNTHATDTSYASLNPKS